MKNDNYHAGKLSQCAERGLKIIAGTSDLRSRLIWATQAIPLTEFYLDQLRKRLPRPKTLVRFDIDPLRSEPARDAVRKIIALHWRRKHELSEELVEWFIDAECAAREVRWNLKRAAA